MRVVFLVMTLVLGFAVAPTPTLAADTAGQTVVKVVPRQVTGSNLPVDVVIEGLPAGQDVLGLNLELSFNPALLRYQSFTRGSYFNNVLFWPNPDVNNTAGSIKTSLARTLGSPPASSGTILTITFSVVGQGISTLGLPVADLRNRTNQAIPLTREEAQVTLGEGGQSSPPAAPAGPAIPADGGTDQGQLPAAVEISRSVDPARGGVVEDAGKKVRIEIPAGAVQVGGGTVRVDVRETARSAAAGVLKGVRVPQGVRAIERVFELTAETAGTGPATPVRTFHKPVTFTVSLSSDDLRQIAHPEKLGLFRLNDDGTLTFVGGRFTDGKLVVQMHGFSRYVLAEVDVTFTDLAGHWAKGDVELMASKYVVTGLPGGRFDPNGPVTRAQFAALLVRALGLPRVEGAQAEFRDVRAGDWHFKEVMTAVRAGIIRGLGDGTFGPDAPVTREQMAAMLARALKAGDKAAAPGAAEVSSVLAVYADRGQLSSWAVADVALAVKEGIVRGQGGQGTARLAPGAGATRAEAAAMVARFWRK